MCVCVCASEAHASVSTFIAAECQCLRPRGVSHYQLYFIFISVLFLHHLTVSFPCTALHLLLPWHEGQGGYAPEAGMDRSCMRYVLQALPVSKGRTGTSAVQAAKDDVFLRANFYEKCHIPCRITPPFLCFHFCPPTGLLCMACISSAGNTNALA